MENVVQFGMLQHFKTKEKYLSYVESKYGPYYVRTIEKFADDKDFLVTYNKMIDCIIVDGGCIRNADKAGIFNLCAITLSYRLKTLSPVAVCLLFIELLDKPELKKRFNNLYTIIAGVQALMDSNSGVNFWNGSEIPRPQEFNYGNFSYCNLQPGVGLVFGVAPFEPVPVGYDRA